MTSPSSSHPDALLVVESAPAYPDLVGARYELSASQAPERGYCIGRAKAAEISLPVEKLSRCTIFVQPQAEGWYLEDRGSANLPEIEGAPTQRHPLKTGDLFTVAGGAVSLRFTVPSSG